MSLPLSPSTQLRDTLDAMAALVTATGWTGVVRDYARFLWPDGAEWSDPNAAALSVYNHLLTAVRFRRDPAGEEMLRFPDQLIAEILRDGVAYGDCDERATLGAAMLAALGHRPAFVVVKFQPGGPWKHVYFGVYDQGGELIPLDPQAKTEPGYHTRNAEKIIYDV